MITKYKYHAFLCAYVNRNQGTFDASESRSTRSRKNKNYNTMIDKFLDDVFAKFFNENITDEIFQFIEKDPVLNAEYLRIIGTKKKGTVNQEIGRQIKKRLGLKTIKEGNIAK